MSFDPAADGWRPMPSAPLPGGLGIPWSKRDDQGWRYGLLTVPDHANPQGALHGGVLMTLADHGLSLVAWEAARRAPCTTIQLNTHFVAAVRPGDFVWVRGEVTRRTGSMVFTRGLMATPERDVAAVDGIWRILRST
ncbi:MAG: PaaI family thioesterase [Acetobacteraceae bacterium]